MPATLVSNNSSVAAQFNLQNSTSKLQASIARLSSGNRITKAGDDVASLAVGTQFRAFVNILKAGFKNAAQATSMLGVADGALQAIGEILQRQSSLASQAKSGSLDQNARAYLNQEFQGLKDEVDRIAENTNFNSIKMINGNLDKGVGQIETNTATDTSTATTSIKFGNGSSKYFNVGAKFDTTAASKTVTVTLNNHGFQDGDLIDVNLVANIDTTVTDDTGRTVTVVDENTFTYVATAAATAGGTGGGAAADSIMLNSNSSKCYDLLDGDTLNINGITFTAKNTEGLANNYTGANGEIRTNTSQTAAELATEVKAAIDRYIANKGTNYERLQGVEIKIDPADSARITFTHKSKGIAGNNFFISTGGGAQITGDTIKYVNNNTFVTSGGTGGDLAQFNAQVYGTVKDSIIKTLGGAQATAAFTIATNPSATSAVGPTIDNTNATVNADGTAIKVTVNGHGYKGGEVIRITGTTTVTNSGLTIANNSDYKIRVLDEDNYEFYGAGITGTFTGYQAALTAGITYTHTVTDDQGDRLNVNGKVFRYVAALTGKDDEILIGADIAATRKNTVEVLNKSLDPRVMQATYAATSTAGEIQATYKAIGTSATNRFTLGGAKTGNLTITNRTLTGGTAAAGVDVSKITNNANFVGKISGFKAEYVSSNSVDLSVKVGDYTYKASGVNTSPTSDTWVTLVSTEDGGGSFRIQMAGGSGQIVTDSTSAASFARRIDNAFSDLKVTQRREIGSFKEGGTITNGTTTIGSLLNAKIYYNDYSFNSIKIDNIKFAAPSTGNTDARIEMTINGERYETGTSIGATFNKGSLLRLRNENDPSNRYIELRIGSEDLNLSSAANAAIIQEAYKEALDAEANAGGGVNFQVGTEASDNINVKIGSAKTSDIYVDENGSSVNLSIETAEKAGEALDVIQRALVKVNAIRAQVGVYQSRFDYASAAINASIQNQDAARSEFLDTKIEEESSEMAMHQVRMNASISVLAQANQITQGLLQLLRS
ncbi:MAG: hypothetical protein K0Q51_474 [Rickettsiaceae bacterium]|jgi:flagellin|nr:hypothetical protein [Rickettsiaceae bacterium]